MRTITVLLMILLGAAAVGAETLTLNKTLERLVNQSTRGKIIAGQREVAHEKFRAEKIGYFLPQVSFNTTLPSYMRSQNYDTYPGFTDPLLFKRTNISGDANIRLKQKVISGGEITMETQYNLRNDEYPSASVHPDTGLAVATDKRRLGNLYLQFTQPIFQNSPTRSAYTDARDNLAEADVQWRVDMTNLKREGITAHFDYLTADLDGLLARHQSDLATFNAQWDSVKYAGGVITEETWLFSRSKRLEKQLAVFDAEASLQEKTNQFKLLIDLPAESDIMPEIPPVAPPPDSAAMQRLLANTDKSAETQLAEAKLRVAERTLARTRSSYGLNATLNASYAVGRGTVKQSKPEREIEDKIDTRDWRVSVDVSYPIWDGGASGAGIHSQELAYESARLEFAAAERSARNKLTILLKRIEINHAKLSLLEQELGLSEKKLRDAEDKHQRGFLSDGALLENNIAWVETRKKHVATLKEYYLDLTELEKIDLP